jgi:hypothetical protein
MASFGTSGDVEGRPHSPRQRLLQACEVRKFTEIADAFRQSPIEIERAAQFSWSAARALHLLIVGAGAKTTFHECMAQNRGIQQKQCVHYLFSMW